MISLSSRHHSRSHEEGGASPCSMQSSTQLLAGDKPCFAAKKGSRASRRAVRVHAAGPPPAWPGRVPVPEVIEKKAGPKVRLVPGTGALSLARRTAWKVAANPAQACGSWRVAAHLQTCTPVWAAAARGVQQALHCAPSHTRHPRCQPCRCAAPPPAQKFSLLGSTGSIGTQTLDIVAENPDKFEIVALAAGSNVQLLADQVLLLLLLAWRLACWAVQCSGQLAFPRLRMGRSASAQHDLALPFFTADHRCASSSPSWWPSVTRPRRRS